MKGLAFFKLAQSNQKLRTVRLCAIVGLATLFLAALLWGLRGVTPAMAGVASFYVTGVSPSSAAITVALDALVSVDFSQAVNFDTVSEGAFTVRGDQTGVYAGAYATGSVQFVWSIYLPLVVRHFP